ncbi:MAG: DUF3592 domain-containing protein [Nitrospirota bacterium]|nr:DUF3592 domain-containing protein [Nitrospirota bacterium]
MQPANDKAAARERQARADYRKQWLRHLVKTVSVTALVLVFTGVFAMLAKPPVTDALAQRASTSWPTAPGVLTDVSATPINPDSGGSLRYQQARISFRYQVGGAIYAGNRIRLIPRTYTDRQHQVEALSPYRKGGRITVHYNPADPAVAVLEPGAEWIDWRPAALPGGLALACLLAILLFWVHAVRDRPRYDYEPIVDLFQQAVRGG